LWWFIGANRTLSQYDASTAIRIFPGIAVLGALGRGFVVADNHGFAFWNRAAGTTQPIAPHAFRLLTTSQNAALFAARCPLPCGEIVYADGATRTFPAPDIVNKASLSPDGRRVAFGNVVEDTTTGHPVARVSFPLSNTPMPEAWTDDGTLLLAIDGAVAVLRPGESDADQIIGLNGLSQIVALP
jgi:hypothetical protein